MYVDTPNSWAIGDVVKIKIHANIDKMIKILL